MESSDTAIMRPDPTEIGEVPLGPGEYRIVRKLGSGGSGTVYLASTRDRKDWVALKLLHVGASEEERVRLRREGRLAARLDHPNIVRVRGVGEQSGRLYLALDLIGGRSLQDRLRDGPLDVVRAASMAERLALALDHAHERGVLHRDVKPSNVLLDGRGQPLLTDFGLAKEWRAGTASLVTAHGDLLGTPSYMAPEQALGEIHRVDQRTDVYGLGATLYAMLTGAPPFSGQWVRVLAGVVHCPPVPPSTVVEVDPDLEEICLKCLEKEPSDRYDSARLLSEALGRWLRSRPRPSSRIHLREGDVLRVNRGPALQRRPGSKVGSWDESGDVAEDPTLVLSSSSHSHDEFVFDSCDESALQGALGYDLKEPEREDQPELELRAVPSVTEREPSEKHHVPRRRRRSRRAPRRMGERSSRQQQALSERSSSRRNRSLPATRRTPRCVARGRSGSSEARVAAGLGTALVLLLMGGLSLALSGGDDSAASGAAVASSPPLARESAPPAPGRARSEQSQEPRAHERQRRTARMSEVGESTPTVAKALAEQHAERRERANAVGAESGHAVADAVLETSNEDAAPAKAPARRSTTVRDALAVLRFGLVTRGGRQFGAGEALPPRTSLRVGSHPAEVESAGSVRVFLAANSRFTVRRGERGRPVFDLERGELFARTTGKIPYAIATRDGVATPLGTEFLVAVSPKFDRTRFATFDGEVRVRGPRARHVLALRAGFEARASKGRFARLPVAIKQAERALRWLPASARPRVPKLPRVLRSFTFDAGDSAGFSVGTVQPGGALGSRWCLRGFPSTSGRVSIRLQEERVFPLARDLWIEATCRTDRDIRLGFRVWDAEREKSMTLWRPFKGGDWVTLTVPLSAFRSSSGSRSIFDLCGPAGRFEIVADTRDDGVPGRLFVDNVRFYRQG